jgi:hypothetical protein
MKVIKYKVTQWIDYNKREIIYGISAKIDKNWYPVKDGNNPLWFDTRDKAQQQLNEFNNEL